MPQFQQHRFAMQLAQLSRAWRAELDRRLVGLGLSQARWLVLLSLARRGDGITQGALAARLRIEAPTLVRTLDWLEAQGFVERRVTPQDRRAKHLSLTPNGKALVEGGMEARQRWMHQLTSTLTPDQQDTIAAALTMLTEAARRLEEEERA